MIVRCRHESFSEFRNYYSTETTPFSYFLLRIGVFFRQSSSHRVVQLQLTRLWLFLRWFQYFLTNCIIMWFGSLEVSSRGPYLYQCPTYLLLCGVCPWQIRWLPTYYDDRAVSPFDSFFAPWTVFRCCIFSCAGLDICVVSCTFSVTCSRVDNIVIHSTENF